MTTTRDTAPAEAQSHQAESHAGSRADLARSEKTRLDKTQQWMTLTSGGIGVLGALGTLAVWLAANFYVGDVVLSAGSGKLVTVKVTTPKGEQATYYARRFQLMPGHYHFEVTEDGGNAQHFDDDVSFRKVTPLTLKSGQESTGDTSAPPAGKDKKKWWQLWKRPAASSGETTDQSDKQASD